MIASLAISTALASTAAAAQPDVEITKDVVFDFYPRSFEEACGFPVRLYTEGFFVTITHYDTEGNPTRITNSAVFHGTLSANGKSISSKVAGPERIVLNEDGTETLTITDVTHRNVPGEGFVSGTAGREIVTFTFDQNGDLISEDVHFLSGRRLPYDAFCAYLAP